MRVLLTWREANLGRTLEVDAIWVVWAGSRILVTIFFRSYWFILFFLIPLGVCLTNNITISYVTIAATKTTLHYC
jgi:hypothetical protein